MPRPSNKVGDKKAWRSPPSNRILMSRIASSAKQENAITVWCVTILCTSIGPNTATSNSRI